MKIPYGYGILGIVIVIVSLILLKNKGDVYKIEKEGSIVKMKILKLPSYCGLTRGKYYADFFYETMTFNKRIPTGFCDKHKVGELVDMKYLESEETVLFPNETVKAEFIAIAIFLFLGLLSIFYSFYNKSK